MQTLKQHIRHEASALGFVRCGFAPVAPLRHDDVLQRWIDQGMAGSMDYMPRTRHQRADPLALLPQARTAIVVVASYRNDEYESKARATTKGRAKVARYARGEDYHRVLHRRLGELDRWLRGQVDEEMYTRIVVDTAPLLERELAMAAGVGFIGKNTMLISPGIGSYTVLGVLLTSLALPPDEAEHARCGSCTLCLHACPTDALRAPYQLDARRCISYLTIEHKGAVPDELQALLGGWIFGCDDCQQVCPYNTPTRQQVAPKPDPALAPLQSELDDLDLGSLLHLRSGAYRRLVRGRALARVSRPNLIRNAAIAAKRSILLDPES